MCIGRNEVHNKSQENGGVCGRQHKGITIAEGREGCTRWARGLGRHKHNQGTALAMVMREIRGRSGSGMGRVLGGEYWRGGVRGEGRGGEGEVTRYLLHVRRDMCCYWTSRTRGEGRGNFAKTETDVSELASERWGLRQCVQTHARPHLFVTYLPIQTNQPTNRAGPTGKTKSTCAQAFL